MRLRELAKGVLIVLCLAVMMLSGCSGGSAQEAERSDVKYVFVHGLSGWGSYDDAYRWMPYWGMLSGDLIKYLDKQGFDCYAASVAPEGSAWDRACELYAQLTGTVVDYGKAHSERCGHQRFGRDFSDEPLLPDWEAGDQIVLLGHSFGGATIRLFSEILANGWEEERAATDPAELSPFFRGGQGERIRAIVTLAAPSNGTTAYDLHEDESFDADSVTVSAFEERMAGLFESRPSGERDGRLLSDYAGFDMHIDNALRLNDSISTLSHVYYFAVPCSATAENPDGTHSPVRSLMEPMYRKSSAQIGQYSGTTQGGCVIDASWWENDGLVNTVSAQAPSGAPWVEYRPGQVEPGVWNVMPVYEGDHMSLQGGLTKINSIRPFYLELLEMIEALPQV